MMDDGRLTFKSYQNNLFLYQQYFPVSINLYFVLLNIGFRICNPTQQN